MKQVQGVSDDLGRAAKVKEELLTELARVQARAARRGHADRGRRRSAEARRDHGQAARAAPHAAGVLGKEDRHASKQRLTDLTRATEGVEQKIKSIAEREALVQAVKAEVESVHKISAAARRTCSSSPITARRSPTCARKVEELLGRVGDTDTKIAAIEARRKMVEEVQTRANAITNLLDDINVNLEMLGEQRAVIDHVGEKLARLDFMVQEAQNTLRALQREREVAERIEQGIKSLRAQQRRASARLKRIAALKCLTVI